MKRRDFIGLSCATGALLFLPRCGDSVTNPDVEKKGLPIPPLMKGQNKQGVMHYDLEIREDEHSFFLDTQTRTLGINGSYLGPTLLINNGDEIALNYTNNLDELVTMHGHGMHAPPKMDGTPHQPILPGKSWTATYTVDQRASTCWYHPHTMDETAKQVYKGLAGLIIVEDEESKALDLPKRYGEDDIPLVLQDRRFDGGQFDYSPGRMEIMQGYVGDFYLANGAIEPTFDAEAKEIRFRILNGSNSSVYRLAFSDGRKFKQIATDAAFLEAPVELDAFILSPGERAEIVVDFTNDMGKEISLVDLKRDKNFLNISVNKEAKSMTTLPATLTTLTRLQEKDAVRTREFVLSARRMRLRINGESMNMDVINETLKLDEIEIWEVKNDMNVDHNFHIHATHFLLLSRNGKGISKNENGYKDCVYIPANESVRFITQMIDYSDATTPYMYHCHFLEHEDDGMMGQFLVTT